MKKSHPQTAASAAKKASAETPDEAAAEGWDSAAAVMTSEAKKKYRDEGAGNRFQGTAVKTRVA